MVGHRLRKSVEWMEGVTGVRGWDNPFVVRLMKSFVDKWVMQASVNPIDSKVREQYKQGYLKDIIPKPRTLGRRFVHFAVATDFEKEEESRQQSH